MGLRDRLRMWRMSRKAAAAGAAAPIFPEWLRYSFMQPSFQAMVKEGYKGNGAAFACISTLAFAFPEPPLLVWHETDGGKDPLRQHPLSVLLKHPNPQMGLAEMLQYTIIYMAVGGNCYWYKVRSRAGRVVQMWPLHDGQMSPIMSNTNMVARYDLSVEGGQTMPVPVDDVVHFRWLPDPLQPHKGLAPLVAVAREVDTDNEATRYLFALLKNDAMPRLALVVPPDVELSKTQYETLKGQWGDEHSGDRRGGVAILEGGLDVKTLASNLRDLEFNILRRVPEARMSAAFRVPAILAGLNVGLEQSTYSNYHEATIQFTERTLIPMWSNIADNVTTDLLVNDFGGQGDQVVEFDLDKVIALQTRTKERQVFALSALQAGGFTRNEFRAVCGLKPDPHGAVYMIGSSVVMIDQNAAAVPALPAPAQPAGGTEPAPAPATEPARPDDEGTGQDADGEPEAGQAGKALRVNPRHNGHSDEVREIAELLIEATAAARALGKDTADDE